MNMRVYIRIGLHHFHRRQFSKRVLFGPTQAPLQTAELNKAATKPDKFHPA